MTTLRNSFNFCPSCYQEGNRFLKVTDSQKEELNQFYQSELQKKDEIISSLKNSYEVQQQFDQSTVEDLKAAHTEEMTKMKKKLETVQRALESKYKKAKSVWENDMKQLREVLEHKIEECITLQEINALEVEGKEFEIKILKRGMKSNASRDCRSEAVKLVKDSEVEELKKEHQLEMKKVKNQYEEKLDKIMNSNTREIVSNLESKHQEEMMAKDDEISKLKEMYEREIDSLIVDHLNELESGDKSAVSKSIPTATTKGHCSGSTNHPYSEYHSQYRSRKQAPNYQQRETIRKLQSGLEQRKKQLATATQDLQEIASELANSSNSDVSGINPAEDSAENQSKMILYNANKQVVKHLMKEVDTIKKQIASVQSGVNEDATGGTGHSKSASSPFTSPLREKGTTPTSKTLTPVQPSSSSKKNVSQHKRHKENQAPNTSGASGTSGATYNANNIKSLTRKLKDNVILDAVVCHAPNTGNAGNAGSAGSAASTSNPANPVIPVATPVSPSGCRATTAPSAQSAQSAQNSQTNPNINENGNVPNDANNANNANNGEEETNVVLSPVNHKSCKKLCLDFIDPLGADSFEGMVNEQNQQHAQHEQHTQDAENKGNEPLATPANGADGTNGEQELVLSPTHHKSCKKMCLDFIDPLGADSFEGLEDAETANAKVDAGNAENANNAKSVEKAKKAETLLAKSSYNPGGKRRGGDHGGDVFRENSVVLSPESQSCKNLCWDFIDPIGAL